MKLARANLEVLRAGGGGGAGGHGVLARSEARRGEAWRGGASVGSPEDGGGGGTASDRVWRPQTETRVACGDGNGIRYGIQVGCITIFL